MFDHINQHQEKLFNLSKVILIVVALLMSITVIYFMFFYKNNEITKGSVSKAQVESVELVNEP
jgi:Na+/melibiose symporter-like transporter